MGGDTSGKTQGLSWWLGNSLEVLVRMIELMILSQGPLLCRGCALQRKEMCMFWR